jgi:DNA-binding transcriptional MerR regulator
MADTGEQAPRRAGAYYSISEVAEQLEVKPHVLRYWETQFPHLRPRKHRSGSRRYTDKDIDLLRTIREMLHERGYTIAGAKARLLEERRQQQAEEAPQRQLDFLAPSDRRQLRMIREELMTLRERLLAPPVGGENPVERRRESR